MKKPFFILSLLAVVFFSNISVSHAIRGACSYHGGVNCDAGAGIYGKVVCNDGWINSSVYFYEAEECKVEDDCPIYISDESYYYEQQDEIESKIRKIKRENEEICDESFERMEDLNQDTYDSCVSTVQNSIRMSGGMNMVSTDCTAEKNQRTNQNEIYRRSCLNEMDDIIYDWERLSRCLILDTRDRCSATFTNTYTYNGQCVCNAGYEVTEMGCVSSSQLRESICLEVGGYNAQYDAFTDTCNCKDGYVEVEGVVGDLCQACPFGSTEINGSCVTNTVMYEEEVPVTPPAVAPLVVPRVEPSKPSFAPVILDEDEANFDVSEEAILPTKRTQVLIDTAAVRKCPSTQCTTIRYVLEGTEVELLGQYTESEWNLVSFTLETTDTKEVVQGWVYRPLLIDKEFDESDTSDDSMLEETEEHDDSSNGDEGGVWRQITSWVKGLMWWR